MLSSHSSLNPHPRALIIRNIETIDYDEIISTLKLAGIFATNTTSKPFSHQSIKTLHKQINSLLDNNKTQQEKLQAKNILRNLLVQDDKAREYLEKKAAQNGQYLILHKDDDNPKELKHILKRLNRLKNDTAFQIILISGGHGTSDYYLSGLKKSSLNEIINIFNNKNVTANGILLGSCYSASFCEDFRPFLKNDGAMISDTTTCGGRNHYTETIDYLLGESKALLAEFQFDDSLYFSLKNNVFNYLKANPDILTLNDFKKFYIDIINLDLTITNNPDVIKIMSLYPFLNKGLDNTNNNNIELLKNIQIKLNEGLVTGKCISTPKGHQVLKLDKTETGMPLYAHENDDVDNNKMIKKMGEKPNNSNTISQSLSQININKQIDTFNYMFSQSVLNEKNKLLDDVTKEVIKQLKAIHFHYINKPKPLTKKNKEAVTCCSQAVAILQKKPCTLEQLQKAMTLITQSNYVIKKNKPFVSGLLNSPTYWENKISKVYKLILENQYFLQNPLQEKDNHKMTMPFKIH